MFATAYFGPRYWGNSYWGTALPSSYFGRFFGGRYFGPAYWSTQPTGGVGPPVGGYRVWYGNASRSVIGGGCL